MKSIHCGFNSRAGADGSSLLIQFGPTMMVDIGFDPAYVMSDAAPPNLPMKGVHALVDTGATDSCVDTSVAMQLNLPIFDQRKVSGVNGEMDVNMHLAHIHIPGLPHTLYGAFAGVNLLAGGQPHAVLIGRTFLRHFKLYYDGETGSVVIFDEIAALRQPQTPSSVTF